MLTNRVRELRARFNWTQEELGKKVGVTRQTISFIEKGDYTPSVTLALKISKVFSAKVEEVFSLGGED